MGPPRPGHQALVVNILRAVAGGLDADLTIEELEADWHAIGQTTLNQANAAVRRLLGDGDFHLALVGPAQKIVPQLKGHPHVAVFPFRTPPERWRHDA